MGIRASANDDPVRRQRWPFVTAAVTAAVVLGGTPFVVRAHSHSAGASAPASETSSSAAPSQAPVSIVTAPVTLPVSVVPWANLATDPANNPQPLPNASVDPSLPSCLIAQLTAETEGTAGAMGTNYLPINIHRVSGPPCVLHDTVTAVSGATKSGVRLDFPLAAQGSFDPSVIPVALVAPSDVGTVRLAAGSMCPDQLGGHYYPPVHKVVVTLATAGALHVESPFVGFGCSEKGYDGLTSDDAGIRAPDDRFTPVSLEQLTATIHAPSTASAGETIDYTVTLTNPTDSAIGLSPCPNFTQGLKGSASDHALNCAAAHPIPSGGSETFAMRLTVPEDPADSNSLVVWGLHTGNGFVGGNLPITLSRHAP